MKKTLLILAVLLCCCFALKAQEIQEFTSEGLNYSITGTNPPTVALTRVPENFTAHDFVTPSTVDYKGTTYSVTSIGEWAFNHCYGLTGSLTIGSSVTSIGYHAFNYCYNLTGSLTIGNAVESIGQNAFNNCSGFTGTLTIGSSVTSIENYAFDGCSGFTGSLSIPNSVTSIGSYAFQNCSGFNGSLTIGNSVESIGEYAFAGCENLTGATIPSSMTSIARYTFTGCIRLASVTIPNSVTSIGESAFSGCVSLAEVTIPSNITSIAKGTFYGCSMTSVTIPSNVTSIGESAFSCCTKLESVTIPNSVTSIDEEAFGHCSRLTEVTIPSSMTSIATNTFNNCASLASVTIPNSVTSIGEGAFKECRNLSSVTISRYVTSIGHQAFYGVRNMISMSVTPPATGGEIFDEDALETITVPCNSVYSYENASGWMYYWNKINGDLLCTLNVSSANNAQGTASIDALPTDCQNNVATVSAHPVNGYLFANWTENGNQISSSNPYTLPLDNYRNLVAHFVKGQYDFSAECSTGQTLYFKIIDTERNFVSIVSPKNDSWNGVTRPTGNIVIPETIEYDGTTYTVTEIGRYAFEGCSGLTGALTIPSTVKTIRYNAFLQCSGFTGPYTIPNNVTTIESWAFAHCTGIGGQLVLPDSLTVINDYAFYWNTSITSISIPNSVTSIGSHAFYYGRDLRGSLVIPNSVTYIGEEAFHECGYDGQLVLSDSLQCIDFAAFANCQFVGSLNIPNSVKSIKNNVFSNCNNFTGSLDIPDSVEEIGEHAFCCRGLSGTITIGNSVTRIGLWAFDGNFSQVLFKPTTPPSIASLGGMFYCDTTPQILVPCGYEAAYRAAPYWETHYGEKLSEGIVYTINVSPADEIEGEATVFKMPAGCNEDAIIQATPSPGYVFLNWTEDGEEVSTENPYTFTLERDRHLVANFYRKYDFSATCSTGQTLYYRIIIADQNYVSIVAPNGDNANGWNDFAKPANDIILPKTVEYDGTSYTVIGINNYAFYKCDGLTGSLVIPNSVISIGNDAFSQCSGFTGSLTIPNSVTSIGNYTFNQCSSFTGSLTIPNSVTSIGQQAFENCNGFNGSLTIGNAVTSIGQLAFNGCSGFTGSLTIGSSVTSIENYAFYGCSGFTNIIAKPATPPTLSEGVFERVTGLQTITVPCGKKNAYIESWSDFDDDMIVEDFVYGLTVASANPYFGSANIERYASCDNLQATVKAEANPHCRFTNWTENGEVVSVDNPYTFTQDSDCHLVANFFRNYDFTAICETGQTLYYRIIDTVQHWVSFVAPLSDNGNGWDGITQPKGNITLPGTVEHNGTTYTVTSIERNAFYGCSGLTGSLTIPNSVESIGNYAFYGCSGFNGSLTIGNALESIGYSAFSGCLGFNGSLNIPNSVTRVGSMAFYNCSGFNGSLNIPNSVRYIERYAFSGCSGFTGTLTIGASVWNIGERAFENTQFTQIIAKPTTPPILDMGAFHEIPDATGKVYIPKNTTDSYESAWAGLGYTFIEYDREDYRFNGSTSSNAWTVASNWEDNAVPAQNSPIVFINADCQLDANAEVGMVAVTVDKTLTIAEDYTLTADLITLENGAQLVNNGTVACNDITVKKNIEGYGTSVGNWYLVSSPVTTTSLPAGMATAPAEDYDLYRFSQAGDSQGREWLNYKAESFGIENQSGYLYANKNNTTILFHGGFAATGTKTLIYDANAEFAGFNLVGNPYPCNTRIGRSFYRMNTAGTELIADVADAEIAPCEGVFVQAQGTGESVTFTPSATPATRSLPSATVALTLSQSRSAAAIDRAIVRLGEGDVLGKMMLNADGTRLYIPQNGKDYAVVSTDATRGEMPLNFKAAKNGSYTITVNVDNADLNYLHLVDNLTGNDVDLLGSEGDVARNVSTSRRMERIMPSSRQTHRVARCRSTSRRLRMAATPLP